MYKQRQLIFNQQCDVFLNDFHRFEVFNQQKEQLVAVCIVHKLSKNKFSNVYELTEDESRHAGRLDKSHY